MQDLNAYFKDNINLVHHVSNMFMEPMMRSGMCASYEDVFQEFSLQFIKAFERYEPDRGLKFSTMYVNYCINRMRWLDSYSKRDKRSGHLMNFSEITSDTDEDFSFQDTICSDYMSPEEKLEAVQEFQQAINGASVPAKLVIEWLIDTPAVVEQAIRAFVGREVTDSSIRPVVVRFVAKTLGLTKQEELKLGQEVAELIGA